MKELIHAFKLMIRQAQEKRNLQIYSPYDSFFLALKSTCKDLIAFMFYISIGCFFFVWVREALAKYIMEALWLVPAFLVYDFVQWYRRWKEYRHYDEQDYYARKGGEYHEYCRDMLLRAEYCMEIAERDVKRYGNLSICTIIAMVFTQLFSSDAIIERVQSMSAEIGDTLAKGIDQQFESMEAYGILCCIVLGTVLYFLWKHLRGETIYRKWRYRKLMYTLALEKCEAVTAKRLTDTMEQ